MHSAVRRSSLRWVSFSAFLAALSVLACGDDATNPGGSPSNGGGGSDAGAPSVGGGGSPSDGGGGNPANGGGGSNEGGTGGTGGGVECGNNDREADEVCDGTDLAGETCASLGLGTGDLGCLGDCTEYDTSGCESLCGNGDLDVGEQCDDGNTTDGDGCEGNCTISAGGPSIVTCQTLTPLPGGARCDVTAGNDRQLISGDILVPGQIFVGGQVLIDQSGIIECVGCDCEAQAAGATEIVCPDGVVSPGLINTHDHITFTQNNPYVDVSGERYEHRHDWRTGAHGHTEIPAAGGASQNAVRWGELRFLMGGATSTVGSGGQVGFLRNLDSNNQEGLGQPPVNFETFPLDDSGGAQRDGNCNYGAGADTEATIANDPAYFPHISEGIDAFARNEFLCTSSTTFDTTAPGVSHDLLEPQSAFIHSIGLKPVDYAQMAQDSTAIIWSPRSNISLYGDTAVVTEAANLGVLIALGTDWVVSGSMNMLRELQCADQLNSTYYDNFFSDQDLWLMTTLNAANATATDDVIGVLANNRVADIAIFDGSVNSMHRAVIDAQPEDVVLVMRGGKSLYGDAAVVAALETGCDTVDVCGSSKRVCAQSEVNQSFTALAAANSTIYPAFFCGTPQNEPSCLPERPVGVNGSTVYDGIPTGTDADGDGIADASDNCPAVFNPVRPVDDGVQADFDTDGEGDACDVCPLDADTTTCTVFDPNDQDSDGVPNLTDNCPADPNTNQADADSDLKGDVCDACPAVSNPGNAGCPATIYDIKDGTIPEGQAVVVTNALVTGKGLNGFFAQVKAGDAGYSGPDYSGIFVFTGPASPNNMALVGNRVTINASVENFNGQLELSTVVSVTITSATVEAAPAPVVETAANLRTGGARAEELEGVVVSVANATVAATMDSFNEFTITDGATINVDDFLFLTAPSPPLGRFYTAVSGVLAFRNSASKILIRGAADLAEGLTLASFNPGASFLDVGDTAASSYPTPLTVTLNSPAPSNTFVQIESDDDTTVSVVGGGVTIPIGQTSAQVLLNGESTGTATLTATLGPVSLDADVTVLDPSDVPILVDIEPATTVLASGGTQTLTVTLDIPAQTGGELVALSLVPSTAGTVPGSVTVLQGQLTATFDYVDNGTFLGDVTITATHNGETLNSVITVADASSDHLVINEVDYDQPGTDSMEFVEIYNGTGGPVSLANLALVFINGSNNTEYFVSNNMRLSLASLGSLPNGQYLVVGPPALIATLPPGTLSLATTVTTNVVQNGPPDAVGIYNTATSTLVDALSYEGDIMAGVPGGDYREGGSGLSVANAGPEAADATSVGSVCRIPNGEDTNVTAADWQFTATPTPGAENLP